MAGHVAVDPVGGAQRAEQEGSRGPMGMRSPEQQPEEDGDAEDGAQLEVFKPGLADNTHEFTTGVVLRLAGIEFVFQAANTLGDTF